MPPSELLCPFPCPPPTSSNVHWQHTGVDTTISPFYLNGISIYIPTRLHKPLLRFKKIHITLAKVHNHIRFLRRCKKQDMVPPSMLLRITGLPQEKREALRHRFGLSLLREHLSLLYRKRESASAMESQLHHQIRNAMPPHYWILIWIWVLSSEKEVFLRLREKHLRKFQNLLGRTSNTTPETVGLHLVKNLSSHKLTPGESSLLQRGLNFVPCQARTLTTKTLASTQEIASRAGSFGDPMIRETISYLLPIRPNRSADNMTRDERQAIQSLKHNKDLIITKADKGGAVVLLDAVDYHSKMLAILSSAAYKQLPSNPASRLENKLKTTVTSLKKKDLIGPALARSVLSNNYKLPTIYGLPKIHKDGIPLRPIVSTLGTPWSPLGKFLQEILHPLAYPPRGCAVRNTQEFAKGVKTQPLSRTAMFLSLDVVNLFGSVPKLACLQVVKNRLQNDNTLRNRTPLPVESIMELLTQCVSASFFKYADHFYEQSHGLAMGSPLSPALASIYMLEIEEKMVHLTHYQAIQYMARYVDDYFLIWTAHKDDFLLFYSELNNIDVHVKFTYELEQKNRLPFLDVMVLKSNQGIKLRWYQKPTTAGFLLNFASDHPPHVCNNIARNMGDKIRGTSDYVGQDLSILKRRLQSNGYPTHVAERLCSKTRKPGNTSTGPQGRKPLFYVPHHKHGAPAFKSRLKRANITVGFRRNKNLGEILHKFGKTDGFRESHVVYKVPCQCGQFYVGETGRELRTRLDEHKRAIAKGNMLNGLAAHVMETGHTIDYPGVEILDREPHVNKRKYKEAFFIRKLQPTLNLNNGLDINDLWCTVSDKIRTGNPKLAGCV